MRHEGAAPKCFPVSFNQRRLWIVDQLYSGMVAYHIPVCLRLRGQINLDSLERSLAAIVDRHESLRTTFGVRDGVPVQLIGASRAIPLQVLDISSSSHPSMDVEAQAYSFARGEIQKPFDLSSGPLIRAVLLRLGPENHILVTTMHHIVTDGWSAELFIRELAEYYGAFSAGREPSLKPLAMQYSDFALLQRHLVANERIEQQLSFWRETLAGAPALHDLPSDHARPAQPTYAGASQTLHLDNELVTKLQQFARHQRITFFMLLTATFQVLLSKYSNQQDILIGIPVSGRNIVETETLIGLFVNTIVLRTSLSGNPQFIEVLRRVRENLLDAMSHQDVPFELIVNTIRAPRGLGYNPLFQIMFATFRGAVQSREFGQLTATPYVVESGMSPFDLSVNIIESLDGTWWARAEYSTELFDRARIANILDAYKMLLWSILTHSHQRLSEMQLMNGVGEVSANTLQPKTSSDARGSIANSSTHRRDICRPARETTDIGSSTSTRAKSPFDLVEGRLVEIWQKILKTSPIDVDDDFFMLGGNSLLAIKLVADVNRAFGKTLPVSSLFREPTIRSMARRLNGQLVCKSSFVPLVTTGTKPPLFVAANVRELRDLSRALGSDQPFYQMDVYALQEERLIAGSPLLTTVQDIASHFVHEILEIQHVGPYFLAGQCSGGIVVLEIAWQLQRKGHEIGALMQFDTPVTGYFPERPPWYKRLPRAFFAYSDRWERLFRFFRNALATRIADHIWMVTWDAVRAHGTDRLFDGEIVLFRAEQPFYRENFDYGWDQLGPVRIYDVPGNHLRLFTNSTAQTIIRQVLEDAQRQIEAKDTKVEQNS
jgi:thioesterase domain-containing protein